MKQLIYITCLLLIARPGFGQAQYEVTSLKQNSIYKDYGVKPYNNGVVFCSNKKNDLLISYLNSDSEEPLTQIYFMPKKEFAAYGAPTIMAGISQNREDKGPFDLRNENEIYFTKSYIGKKGPTLGIFSSRRENGQWSIAQPFEHNNDAYKVAHPAFSDEGNTLYFSANFSDAYGGADIYVSYFENGVWTTPKNLGSNINSKQSELYPTVHPDGSLAFSSNRKDGLGGMDIYLAEKTETGLSSPQLLEEPFNSAADDFAYYVNASKTNGYFSSNRTGNDDMYEFKLIRPAFSNCPTQQKNSYCYLFYDESHINLDTLPLRYEWNMGDGKRYRNLEAEHCFIGPGTYQVQLNIIDTLTGDLFFSQANYELEIKDIEQVYIESADTVSTHTEIHFDGFRTNLSNFEVESYYWYFEDQSYYEAPEVYYAFHEEGEYNITLGARSKPDAKGLVKQACVQKQVTVLPGYANNALTAYTPGNQTSDAFMPTGGLYNYLQPLKDSIEVGFEIPENTIYRVEILKSKERVSTLDRFFDGVRETYDVYENYIGADSLFCYAVGDENELNNTYPIYAYIKSINYSDAEVKAFLPEHIYTLENLEAISEDELNHAVFRSGSVYFESNNFILTENADPTLRKIQSLMERYPNLRLEVGAHTDNMGTSGYNIHLSKRRSMAVIEYLIKQNIDPSRLTGVGYGSELPIADNTTDAGRKLNRRVEFKVLSTH
jgi:outer membrane protein OmpA-like peptidoglycan-associated protein